MKAETFPKTIDADWREMASRMREWADQIDESLTDGDGAKAALDSRHGVSSRQICDIMRLHLDARRKRNAVFGDALFGEPSWDILLDLYISEWEGRSTCISSACIAACVPPTTALRWIETLVQEALVERVNDSRDKRRIHLTLTDKARDLLIKWAMQCLLSRGAPNGATNGNGHGK